MRPHARSALASENVGTAPNHTLDRTKPKNASVLAADPAGIYALRVYRNGFEYRPSTGDEVSLRREAAAKLEALLATNWEQIT